ncbi:MAG: hypothetical protein ACPG7F_09020 [Aggregatilineales bacterium]
MTMTTAPESPRIPVTPQEISRPRRNRGMLLLAVVALTVSLFAGLVMGSVWISSDDNMWLELFTTPFPTMTPTPEIALDYVDNAQAAGYVIWALADYEDWLVENDSSSSRAVRSAIELLENRIQWTQAEHPSLNKDEQAAVDLIRRNVEAILTETVDNQNFEICFLIHPDERVARILELGVKLPEAHNVTFLETARYVPIDDFERYIVLEDFERSCTIPPAPEKR